MDPAGADVRFRGPFRPGQAETGDCVAGSACECNQYLSRQTVCFSIVVHSFVSLARSALHGSAQHDGPVLIWKKLIQSNARWRIFNIRSAKHQPICLWNRAEGTVHCCTRFVVAPVTVAVSWQSPFLHFLTDNPFRINLITCTMVASMIDARAKKAGNQFFAVYVILPDAEAVSSDAIFGAVPSRRLSILLIE